MSAVSDLRQKYATAMQFREGLDEGYSTLDLSAACIIHLTDLLDIVEAVSAREPVDWYGERACLYCRVNIGDGDDHTPDCSYRRARELCGMEQAGTS